MRPRRLSHRDAHVGADIRKPASVGDQYGSISERTSISTDNYWRMKFTRQQIDRAIDLKKGGIPWKPCVGQYALDWHGIIKPASPFQIGVYFFLDYPCFVEYFGSEASLEDNMVWLPTLEQSIKLAEELELEPASILRTLMEGIDQGDELSTMYELIRRVCPSSRH